MNAATAAGRERPMGKWRVSIGNRVLRLYQELQRFAVFR